MRLDEQTKHQLLTAASNNYRRYRRVENSKPTDAENYELVRDAFIARGIDTHTADGRFTEDYAQVLRTHVLYHDASDCVYRISSDGREIIFSPPLKGDGSSSSPITVTGAAIEQSHQQGFLVPPISL